MPTNKIDLKSEDQFTADFIPLYNPLFSLFLENSVSYPAEVGELNMKSLKTIGDIRAKRVTPKDTVIKQIAVASGSKAFKKYFFKNQYTLSLLQAQEGTDGVLTEVLDEHNKQADDLLLLGEGTSASNMINNGLFWSNDPNYLLKASAAVAAGTAADHLKDMYAKILATVAEGEPVSGRKVLYLYGDTAISKYSSIFSTSDASFKDVLAKGIDPVQVVKVPSAVTPASSNGWILVNHDQVKLHYTKLPGLDKQGINDEEDYAWFNFLIGSMMLEVKAKNAIIRQPVTFA